MSSPNPKPAASLEGLGFRAVAHSGIGSNADLLKGPHVRTAAATKEWFPGMFVIFTSHQWLSSTHPDPQGQQMEALQKALRGMIDGSLQVHEDIVSRSDDMNLSNTIRQHITEGFLFFDSRLAEPLYTLHFWVSPLRSNLEWRRVTLIFAVIGLDHPGLVCHPSDHRAEGWRQ